MEQEIWKQSYVNGYEVSSFGRVRNAKTQRIMSCEHEEKGYQRLSIIVDGKKKHFAVHRMVALAFIPNPENFPQVDHIDCDKTNNNVSNLRWCSNKQNTLWRLENGRKRLLWIMNYFYSIDFKLLRTR